MFEPAITGYLQDLRVAKRYSPHTVSNYHRDLKAFAAAALARSVDKWEDVSARDIRSIVAELHLSGISGRSLARKLSALRGLYAYLMKLKKIDNNPAADVLAPKDKKALPSTLDAEEVSRLLKEKPE